MRRSEISPFLGCSVIECPPSTNDRGRKSCASCLRKKTSRQANAKAERRFLLTGARHERHLALATTIVQLILVFFLHFVFVHVPGRRLAQLIPAHGTSSDLKLSTSAPCGLLFFPRGHGNSVNDGNTTVLLPGGTYLRKPVHQPVRWHECVSHSKAL